MGLCGSSGMSKQEKERQKEIEAQLRKDKRIIDQEIKLLLLGAGESGKSTMSKQMKIIHLSGFNEDERKSYIEIICSNIITSMKALVAATEKLDIETEEKNKDAIQNIMNASVILNNLSLEMIKDLKSLWSDKGIQKAFERRNQFQLTDSAAYYFNALDRIGDPNYIPDTQDVLRSRAKTTGITETEFDVNGVHFRMVDVGGQRSERKKWIHCFQDVTAVIFCVAMSEYDLKLFEDETVNRSEESLKLFDEICNSKWFGTTSIILFLNKKDLFAEKIKTIDLNVCFPEYTGGCDFEAASQYLQNKFLSLNRNPAQKNVYPHLTCATDTQSVTFVFNSVKDIILNNVLGDGGI